MTSENGNTGSLSSNDELHRLDNDAERSHSNHRSRYDCRFRSSRLMSPSPSMSGDWRTNDDNRSSKLTNRTKSRGRQSCRSSRSESRNRSPLRDQDKGHRKTRRKRGSISPFSSSSKSRRYRHDKQSRHSSRHERRRCSSTRSRRRRVSRSRSRSSSHVKDDPEGYMIMNTGHTIRRRYEIEDILGEGTFGRVARCKDLKYSERNVAVKVIKAVTRYREAARLEIDVLNRLKKEDPKGKHRCVLLLDWFNYHDHMCLVFELMGKSVFDFLKENDYERYPISHVKQISYQLCDAVKFLHDCKLTHTDLKPENILFLDSSYVRTTNRGHSVKELRNTEIRLIDFGSATFHKDHHSTTVATRHYRAPEVILEMGWSYPCDVWAIGCILYEIYTGQTLFMTHDNLEHLAMMERVLRPMSHLFVQKSRRRRFFSGDHLRWDWHSSGGRYVRNTLRPLDRCRISDSNDDYRVIDLISDMLCYDPKRRITLQKALKHAFFCSGVHYCNNSEDSESSLSVQRCSDSESKPGSFSDM